MNNGIQQQHTLAEEQMGNHLGGGATEKEKEKEESEDDDDDFGDFGDFQSAS